MIEILEEKRMILFPSDVNKKRKCVKVKCSRCGKHVWRDKRSILKLKTDFYCTDDCRYGENRVEVECSYCNSKFMKSKSRVDNSKSGLYFCCREHKDLAQRIEFGLTGIWANHYGNAHATYRNKALRNYGSKCSHCGYDELDICVVHHIDRDRSNNELDNLLVVCPNCHEGIHKGFFIVENRILKEKKRKSLTFEAE